MALTLICRGSEGAIPDKVFLACLPLRADAAELPPCSSTLKNPLSLAVILKASGAHPEYYGHVSKLRIGNKTEPVQPYPDEAHVDIHWYKVEPLMYHTDGKGHDPANPDFLWYANAGAPGGRTDRRPLPPDTVRYVSTNVNAALTPWMMVANAHPSDAAYDIHGGLGTMRYTATVSGPHFKLAAPTMDSYNPDRGSKETIARVVYRLDDSYIGYMTGFFNVPGVFGPYDGEISHHVGLDCSHFVVGARREYSRKSVPYTNVTGLRNDYTRKGYFEAVAGDHYLSSDGHVYSTFNRQTGKLSRPAKIPIRVGDVITCNYSTNPARRQWDHVGVVYEDRNAQGSATGLLNGDDLIINAGPAEPSINRLADSEFVAPNQPTRIAVLRWRE